MQPDDPTPRTVTLADGAVLAGLLLLVIGLGMVYLPLAVMAGGVSLIGVGVAWAKPWEDAP